MIRNYLRVAVRSLLKNKSYIIINTLGLGVSLACCITAYLLLAYNIEFDTFHKSEKVGNIYRLHVLSHEKSGKEARDDAAPIILPPIASAEIAGLGRYTRFVGAGGSLRYEDKTFNEGIQFVDSSFFNMFDFPLVSGNYKSFRDKKSIFISEALAKKYFGDEDPVGKLLVANFINNVEIELLVGGVIKKFPLNNTFYLEAVMRIENFYDFNKIPVDDWSDWRNPAAFIEVPTAEAAQQASRQMSKYIPVRNKLRTDVVVESFALAPFKSYLTQDDMHWNQCNYRIPMVPILIFCSMAVLILLIACFNLTNTSIAMTSKRLKEVGIRKAIGALRRQIALQFLFETMITIGLSLVVGLILAQFIVPAFYAMWQVPYGLKDLDGLNFFIAIIVLFFLAALLAGIYPALSSSKLKPTLLLKGSVRLRGTNFLTRTLVAAQFALSVVVLIGGVVFIQNATFQEAIKFGYDKEMIVTVQLQGDSDFKAMEAAVLRNPKALSVAVSGGNVSSSSYETPVQVDTAKYSVRAVGIGKNYFQTMGLKLSEGRAFDPESASDEKEGIIVNKAFLETTGLRDPMDKIVILHNERRRILGIIENHVDNIGRSEKFEPFVFYPAAEFQHVLMLVRAEKQDLPEMQKFLERTWKEIFPTRPFESSFQEDLALKDSKQTNGNMAKVFLFITILGGLLSASGIFALASLNIAKRTKEIGIRKALGASVFNIVGLLNREFVIILLVAGVLGAWGGYFLTGFVLGEMYPFHMPIGIISVALCALGIFFVGILTTSSTVLRAARSNPVETLRTE